MKNLFCILLIAITSTAIQSCAPSLFVIQDNVKKSQICFDFGDENLIKPYFEMEGEKVNTTETMIVNYPDLIKILEPSGTVCEDTDLGIGRGRYSAWKYFEENIDKVIASLSSASF